MGPKKDKKGTPSSGVEDKAKEDEKNSFVFRFTAEFKSMCNEEGVNVAPELTFIDSSKPSNSAFEGSKSEHKRLVKSASTVEHKRSAKSTTTVDTVVRALEEESLKSLTHGHESPKIRITIVLANPDTLHKILLKRQELLEWPVVKVIVRCLYSYNSITVLRLEQCRLTNDHVELVAWGLSDTQTVHEVSLDGNPLVDPNYHLLLELDTRVKSLSLRLCDINDKGAYLLANHMAHGSANSLLTLNLNHNKIADKGAKAIANALRSNRTLVSLSLVGNRIGDKGATSLARSLDRFQLRHEEVVFRRRRHAACYKKYAEKLSLQRSTTSNVGSLKPGSANTSPRRKRSDGDKKRTSGSVSGSRSSVASSKSKARSSKASFKQPSKKQRSSRSIPSIISEVNLEELIRRDLASDRHPYMQEVTPDSGYLFCSGNLHLANLNLAYNKVGCVGVMALYHVVDHQASRLLLDRKNTGLMRLVLEGNVIPLPVIQVLDEITDILQERNPHVKQASLPTTVPP